MVSTYTQNNGVEKPGVGEQSNTWGVTANTNYDILDRAANGVGTIALTGTSSTLTTLDGSVSDGQYKVLLLTGSLGATHTITISPNDLKKMYMVYNLTGQSVVFTQGSGGNTTIQNGDSAMIYCSGIGATSAVVNIADHLAMSSPRITGGSISGLSAPLAVADGGTGSTTASGARTAFGLGTMATLNTGTAGAEFRTNTENAAVYQPLDATLTAYAGFTGAADLVPYFTAADVLGSMTVTSAARTVLDDTTVGAMLTTLGGQPLDSDLTALAAFTTSGFAVRTGAATWATRAVTSTGSTITITNPSGVAGDINLETSIGGNSGGITLTGATTNLSTVIPDTARQITVSFKNLSTDGTIAFGIQVSDGAFLTTGYVADCYMGTIGGTSATTRFPLASPVAATNVFYGNAILSRQGTDWYFITGTVFRSDGVSWVLGGYIQVTGGITGVRMTGAGDNFDAGQGYVSWI
jgi:hypothetical protein